MKRIISIILIIAGLGLGIYGVSKMNDSKSEIQIGDIELSAKNQDKQNDAYMYLGVGVVALAAGIITLKKK